MFSIEETSEQTTLGDISVTFKIAPLEVKISKRIKYSIWKLIKLHLIKKIMKNPPMKNIQSFFKSGVRQL